MDVGRHIEQMVFARGELEFSVFLSDSLAVDVTLGNLLQKLSWIAQVSEKARNCEPIKAQKSGADFILGRQPVTEEVLGSRAPDWSCPQPQQRLV